VIDSPGNLLLAAVAVTLPAAARAAAIIAAVLIATFARRAQTRRAAMRTLKTLLPSSVDWGLLRRRPRVAAQPVDRAPHPSDGDPGSALGD
jgi:hypothetical protein